MENSKLIYKVLLLGDSAVGKSSLLYRYIENTYVENFLPTIGIDYKFKDVEIDGKTVSAQIWDTAGQDRFRAITSSYYNGAHGLCLIYDVSDRQSFNNIKGWVTTIREKCKKDIPIMLIGNKIDVEEKSVNTAEGRMVAEDFGLMFKETSAKENICVKEAFYDLICKIHERDMEITKKLTLEENKGKWVSSWCC